MEAIAYCAGKKNEADARKLLLTAMGDSFYKIRRESLDIMAYKADSSLGFFEPTLEQMASRDSNKIDKGLAIYFLGNFKNEKYKPVFLKATEDSSYFVAGRALEALAPIDSMKALEIAQKMVNEQPKGRLAIAIQTVLADYGDENNAVSLYDNFENMEMSQKTVTYGGYTKYLIKLKNTNALKMAINQIVDFREKNKRNIEQTRKAVNKTLKDLADQKAVSGLTEQADYIRTMLN